MRRVKNRNSTRNAGKGRKVRKKQRQDKTSSPPPEAAPLLLQKRAGKQRRPKSDLASQTQRRTTMKNARSKGEEVGDEERS